MYIDNNNILCLSTPTNQTKTYTHIVDNYKIEDYDKIIFAYHKKQIKEINFKDLGNNMSVFYIAQRTEQIKENLNKNSFINALNIFNGFNEETGETYAFLPKFPHKELDKTNEILNKLWINIQLKNTEKGIIIENLEKQESIDPISTLFALVIFYWKFEIHNEDLKSAKIHIPLFGQYLSKKEDFDKTILQLQQKGVFIKNNEQETKDGTIYQIVINDYEILKSFANFLKPIEKIKEISKYNYMIEAKTKILEHLNLSLDNWTLSSLTLKLLTK